MFDFDPRDVDESRGRYDRGRRPEHQWREPPEPAAADDGRRVDGSQIHSFYKAWRTACRKARCPGRIPHDSRRTAVRNPERAGVPRSVAMAMVGHKTEVIYRRYAIVSAGDLSRAAEQLDRATGIVPSIVHVGGRADRGGREEILEENVARPKGFERLTPGLEDKSYLPEVICPSAACERTHADFPRGRCLVFFARRT